MEKTIGSKVINLGDDGYLTDFSQWDKDIAIALAKEKNIEMTDTHWMVIEYLQGKHKNDEALSIRGIKKSGKFNIKEFYGLFPGGPLKISTLIAGIPKPKSCI